MIFKSIYIHGKCVRVGGFFWEVWYHSVEEWYQPKGGPSLSVGYVFSIIFRNFPSKFSFSNHSTCYKKPKVKTRWKRKTAVPRQQIVLIGEHCTCIFCDYESVLFLFVAVHFTCLIVLPDDDMIFIIILDFLPAHHSHLDIISG